MTIAPPNLHLRINCGGEAHRKIEVGTIMSPEREHANVASWRAIEGWIAKYPEGSKWFAWRCQAEALVSKCVELGLHRYFRAGQSLHHLVFATLEHHGLRDEPRVTLELRPAQEVLRVAFGRSNLHFSAPELEYVLPFDDGVATFRRFLRQLWMATMPEPVPESIVRDLAAPVLTAPAPG